MDQFLDQNKKRKLFTVLVTLFVVLTVYVAILGLNALKENSYIGRGAYPTNIITVTGTGEVTAIPELLKLIDFKGAFVTIDAQGCQKAIAKEIIDRGANYCLCVKKNQPKLHNYCVEAFANAEKNAGYISDSKGHGRIEMRSASLLNNIAKHVSDKWYKAKAIVKIESEREVGGVQSIENRYFITSSKKCIKYIADSIRSHWGIENLVHRQLDVVLKEDGSRIRKGFGAENASTLRRIVLVLFNTFDKIKGSLEIKRLKVTWNNDYKLNILGGFK